jgi:hypothetical protein
VSEDRAPLSFEEPRLGMLVEERVQALTGLSYSELQTWPVESSTDITIEGRSGAITVFINDHAGDGLLIVVHGFVDRAVARLFSPTIVALDGFWKHCDGSVSPASPSDLEEYD